MWWTRGPDRRTQVAEKESSTDDKDRARFEGGFFEADEGFTRIGEGEIGGKAQGLARIKKILEAHFGSGKFSGFTVAIPRLTVITTDLFDRFMERNKLHAFAFSDARDPHVANAFQKANLPEELVDDLKALIQGVHIPLAIRSSSLLEAAMQEPFSGVYATKMVPNNQFSTDARLRTLMEAIKFVYASVFFKNAKNYLRAAGRSHDEEKMAVIIQEIVGLRHGNRLYPTLSGVARSYNFYSMGHAKPENGVVSLALGLGKTIVEGGRAWTYCPAFPKAEPPFGSTKELLTQTQTDFWSVNMGKPPAYDPIRETEYLFRGNLKDAEDDKVLQYLVSTYDPNSDRLSMGMGASGPRVLNFSPILQLKEIPLNDLVKNLLEIGEDTFGSPVEIEFAVNPGQGRGDPWRFGFLQVRPMFVSDDVVEVREEELCGNNVLVGSEQVLGNGKLDSIKDVVYVKPDRFSAKETGLIGAELDDMNRRLIEAGRPYLLMVMGRLGTSDPWLGIPVQWGQVAGAQVIVETSVDKMNVDMSQGSHFFHNVNCFKVLYFSTDKTGRYPVKWGWLEEQETVRDCRFVRHIVLEEPLHITVDGKSGRGVIIHERSNKVGH